MDSEKGLQMTSDEIYKDLCDKIEHLQYMPGERLSENDICKKYNVTRHVVRNVFAKLKARRLVEVLPQRGTYVSLINMQLISDILYMREAVEQEALLRVFELSEAEKETLILKLSTLVDEQKRFVKVGRYTDDFYKLDNQFHEELLIAIGKPNIMNLISESYIHIRRWRNFEIRTEKRMQEIVQEHKGIIEAISQKKREDGREIMDVHIDSVCRHSKQLMEREPQYFT